MKKLIFILLCFPMLTFANPPQESNSLEKFKQLCRDASDPSIRETYCKLVGELQKAQAVSKDFKIKS